MSRTTVIRNSVGEKWAARPRRWTTARPAQVTPEKKVRIVVAVDP